MRPAVECSGVAVFAFVGQACDGSSVVMQSVPRPEDDHPPIRMALTAAQARMLARRLAALADLADKDNQAARAVRVNPEVAA